MPKSKKEDSQFIIQLYDIINRYTLNEQDLSQRIVQWQSQNKGFVVRDKQKFIKNVLQENFTISRFDSFVRKLNKYGFKRSKVEKDKFRFFHKDFTQDGKSIKKIRKLSKQEALPRHIKLRLMRQRLSTDSLSYKSKIDQFRKNNSKIEYSSLNKQIQNDIIPDVKSQGYKISSKQDIGIYLLKQPQVKPIQFYKLKMLI